jgi:hypothetical protein
MRKTKWAKIDSGNKRRNTSDRAEVELQCPAGHTGRFSTKVENAQATRNWDQEHSTHRKND